MRQAAETADLRAARAAAAPSGVIYRQRGRGESSRWTRDHAGAIGGKRREGQPAVDTREYGVVEDVEGVGTKLDAKFSVFNDSELLLQRHVEIHSARAVKIIDAGFEPNAPNLCWDET